MFNVLLRLGLKGKSKEVA